MAVRHGYGKVAGADALVFAYDTGDTRNSYRGEPTTNLVTDTPSGNGWAGAFTVVDSATKTYTIESRQNNAATTSAWRTHYWSVSSYIGSYVTISADVEFVSETNCTFRDLSIGQGNTGQYPYHIAGSDVADRVQITTKPTSKVHVTWSGVINSTGIVGFTQWINNVTANGANSVLQISNVQIEAKAHETPFTSSTRSVSGSLLDLIGNSSVNLTNMSFDSNAQMTFDGTSDYINFPAGTMPNFGTDDFAIEVIFKMTKSTSYSHFYQVKDQYYFALKMNNPDGRIYVYRTSALSSYNAISINAPTGNNYYHLVCQRNGDNIEMYLNGEYKGSKSGWGSIDIDGDTYDTIIGKYNNEYSQGDQPVTKVYSRALTAGEVKNNYSHYKNRFGI